MRKYRILEQSYMRDKPSYFIQSRFYFWPFWYTHEFGDEDIEKIKAEIKDRKAKKPNKIVFYD